MKVIPASEFENYLGQETGVTDWIEITQERINQFADATDDHQFIHVDPEMAKATPWGTTIAHGFLTLSLVPMLTSKISSIKSVTRGINYGTNKVRFTNMVPVNSKVRAKTKLLEAQSKAGGTQLISEVSIEIEGQDRPAMIAETVSIVFE